MNDESLWFWISVSSHPPYISQRKITTHPVTRKQRKQYAIAIHIARPIVNQPSGGWRPGSEHVEFCERCSRKFEKLRESLNRRHPQCWVWMVRTILWVQKGRDLWCKLSPHKCINQQITCTSSRSTGNLLIYTFMGTESSGKDNFFGQNYSWHTSVYGECGWILSTTWFDRVYKAGVGSRSRQNQHVGQKIRTLKKEATKFH